MTASAQRHREAARAAVEAAIASYQRAFQVIAMFDRLQDIAAECEALGYVTEAERLRTVADRLLKWVGK
ncbi:hypothetical protein HMPREF1317_1561 [Schaalia georgiae F0490]|uniref:Uncharacterized protein n=1 Tax=Schaalia georgiae F0490 TaxID=1125717 RepID=J0P2R1_9ACTO|nr:hypothetical protein [Schaalia georgiae]EJF51677.1 hypothetical protein HMPREF1317_1561 [Schaalia georgiae F0490]